MPAVAVDAVISGDASGSGSAGVNYGAVASISGDASGSGLAGVNYAVTTSLTGDGDSSGLAGVNYAVTSSLTGDGDVSLAIMDTDEAAALLIGASSFTGVGLLRPVGQAAFPAGVQPPNQFPGLQVGRRPPVRIPSAVVNPNPPRRRQPPR